MTWLFQMVTIVGLVIAVIYLIAAVRIQAKLIRWMEENFEDMGIGDYDPELSEFEQEVADLDNDTP